MTRLWWEIDFQNFIQKSISHKETGRITSFIGKPVSWKKKKVTPNIFISLRFTCYT
jgi:hypothetical protein